MSKALNELRKEEMKNGWGNFLYYVCISFGIFETFSGTYLYFVKDMQQIDMMLLLGHLILGFALGFFPFFLLRKHRIYVKAIENSYFRIAGYCIIVLSLLSLGTGAYLTFAGVSGNKSLWLLHLISSYLWAVFQLYYFSTIVRFTLNQKNLALKKFLRVEIFSTSKRILTFTFALVFAAAVGGVVYKKPAWFKEITGYSMPFKYSTSVFYPGTGNAGNNKKLISSKALLNSKSCGTAGCHTEILRQWEASYHKYSANHYVAASFKNYKEEIESGELFDGLIGEHINRSKIASQKTGVESLRLCMGCHDPVSLFTGEATPKANFNVVTPNSGEGVSCLVCHLMKDFNDTRNQIKAKKYNNPDGRYELVEANRYLFSNSNSRMGRYVYETLINVKPESHRRSFIKPSYKDPLYCMGCHRHATHYTPWLNSPYSPKMNVGHPENVKTCQTCHMPQVKTEDDVSAKEKGTIAEHHFYGMGGSIPTYYGFKEHNKLAEKFVKDKRITLKIIAPEKISSTKNITFYVRLANTGIGHKFPGLPDVLNEAWPEVKIKDSKGNVLYTYGELDKDRYLNYEKVTVLGSISYDRAGRPLRKDRHRPWRASIKVRRHIFPKKFIDIPLTVSLKSIGKLDKIQIEAKINSREPNQQFSDWVLGKGKFNVPIYELSNDKVEIEISKNAKDVENAIQKWKNIVDQKEFLDCEKSQLAGIEKSKRSLFDDQATVVMITDLHVMMNEKRYEEANEFIEELKKTYPNNIPLKIKLEPIEKEIRTLLKDFSFTD